MRRSKVRRTGLAVMVVTLLCLAIVPSASAIDILAGRGTLQVFSGWGAEATITYQQVQEVIVGELSGVGATQGPGVNTVTGTVPLLGLFTNSVSGQFGGPGPGNSGAATYSLIFTAPDGGGVFGSECVQAPGGSRSCITI